LEQHQLTAAFMNTINDGLENEGLLLKGGTMVDATLIHAAPSTKNRDKSRDPEMHQTKKGNQWYPSAALIYGLLRFASFFVSMSAGRVTQLRPYIRPLVRSLVISGPDGFPRVFIPIRTPVWMTSERSGFVKTPVRP
jgi:hypothetical protein